MSTFVLAWLPAFVLIRYGFVSHGNRWVDGPFVDGWNSRRSRLALSDWVQVYPPPPGPTARSVGPTALGQPYWATVPPGTAGYLRVDTGATGWPLRALASEGWFRSDRHGHMSEELKYNVRLAQLGSGRIFLPLRPIWGGLLGNTALFSAAWAILILGPIGVRRALRRRGGRCASCGYEVRGAPMCTECGAEVN